VYNIKIDFREIGWDGVDWIDLNKNGDKWRTLLNTVMNLRVTDNIGIFLSCRTTDGFSRKSQLHIVS
jgi:hypothetical protein